VSEAANEAVIERFYHELWNRWVMTVADEIISDDHIATRSRSEQQWRR
jgi:hypothetical protein